MESGADAKPFLLSKHSRGRILSYFAVHGFAESNDSAEGAPFPTYTNGINTSSWWESANRFHVRCFSRNLILPVEEGEDITFLYFIAANGKKKTRPKKMVTEELI